MIDQPSFQKLSGLSSSTKIQGHVVCHNIGTHCMMWHYLKSNFEKNNMAGISPSFLQSLCRVDSFLHTENTRKYRGVCVCVSVRVCF